MKNSRFKGIQALGIASGMALAIAGMAAPVHAFELYNDNGITLNGDLSLAAGVINSGRSYNTLATLSRANNRTWFEGTAIYGLSGEITPKTDIGTFFGAFDLFSGIHRGGRDAMGASQNTAQTQLANAYAGWRSGDTIPWLGHDGLKVSAGRQAFTLGNGYLIGGDRIDLGKGVFGAPSGLKRGGGTFYLASLSSFENTAILELGGDTGFHFKGFWLKSGNGYQGKMSLAGGNLEYHDPRYGMLGLTYIRGLTVDLNTYGGPGWAHRAGQNTWSAYGNTSLGVKQLKLAGQYVREAKGPGGAGQAHSWYASAQWTFVNMPWSPALTYRFNRFSKSFDPLFYGFTDFGTWYQGEVGGNYAGPFNSNADIQFVRLAANPSKNLQLAVNYYNFNGRTSGALNGNEVDVYGVWTIFSRLTIIPLMGAYMPSNSTASGGGTQIGGNGPNILSELLFLVSF